MKIVLLKDVKKIGKKYDTKEVSDGFALNMLIPKGLALPATQGNLNMIDKKKKNDLFETIKSNTQLKEALGQIKGITIELKGKVNDVGHLFAGIHKENIALAIKNQKGINISPEHIILDKPIKEIGQHNIIINFNNQEVSFNLIVTAE